MPKILVIDDEKPIRDALLNILTAEQYQVDIVENGKKGLEMLGENGSSPPGTGSGLNTREDGDFP